MNKWAKAGLFVAGVMCGGFVEWHFLHQPSIGSIGAEPWVLPDFQYSEYNFADRENVYITGSLIGNDAAYKVNTWNIRCSKSDMTCRVADVEEIGRRQLGEINIADWTVTSWTPAKIIAQDSVGDTTNCARSTLVIDRTTHAVRYLSEPVNAGTDWCTKGRKILGPPEVEDWRIGNPRQPWGGYLGKQ